MEMEEQTSSTLFVADLPYNVQESEFVRLFEPLDGFISARLRQDKNERLVGFVEFDSHLTAARARDRLQGSKFGLDDPGISIQFSHGKRSGKRPGSQSEEGFASPRRNLGSNQQDFQFYNFSPFAASPLATGQYVPPNNPSYNQPPWPPASSSSQYLPQVPTDASSTLYVEGVPLDASEREVAHIFRPFPGYQSLRLLAKESKQDPTRQYVLCFVEFDNKYQATIAMHALQGYRFDKDHSKGLKVTYSRRAR